MKSQEEFQDAAERAFDLLERKSPHQLAVELVSMEGRVQAAIDACARMQEQRDQLASQLKDATAQCGVLADLVNRMVIMMGMAGDEPENSSLNPLKAWMFEAQEALSGKLPYLHITKPARIGGVVFQPGIKASSVLEAAYRAAEDYEPNPAAFKALQGAMLAAAPEPEGGA